MSTVAKYICGSIVLICAAFLFFYIFKGCGKLGPDHSQDKKTLDSTTAIVKAINDRAQKKVDSIAKINLGLSRTSDSLIVLVKASKYGVNVKGQEIAGLIARINQLQDSRDTIGQLSNCDSLQGAVTDAIGLVGHYEQLTDSLETTLKSQLSNKDTIIARLDTMFSTANNQLFQTGLKYDQLYNDYNKVNASLKKNKLIGSGLAIAILLLGAKMLIK